MSKQLCCQVNPITRCEGWCDKELCSDHAKVYKYVVQRLSGPRTAKSLYCIICFKLINLLADQEKTLD